MHELTRRGIERFNAGRFSEALECFTAACEKDASPEPRLLLAHVLDADSRPDEARARFAGVIESFPGHVPAYAGLAALLLRRGATPETAAPLRGALALRPSPKDRRAVLDALRLCAQAWRAAGDFEAAEETLRRALRLSPSDRETRRRLVEVLQAREQFHLASDGGDGPPPYELAPDAPGGEGALKRRVRALRRKSQRDLAAGRPEEASRALREALIRDPRDAETRRQLDAALQALPAPRTTAEKLARTALRRACEGDLDAAAAAARRAAREAPRDREARSVLRDVTLMRGRRLPPAHLALAEKAVRRALRLNPRDRAARRRLVDILRRRAQAHLAAGELADSERLMRRALAVDPRNRETKARLAEALARRARGLQSDGRRAQAGRLASRVLASAPGEPRALLIRGEVLHIGGRVKEGRALIARALAKDRAGLLTPADRFKALMKLGRHREAVAVGEKVLDAGPTLSDLRAFWDPWEWDERRPREEHLAELARIEESLGPEPSPWLHYYRAGLSGPSALEEFERLEAFPSARYGWMSFRAGFMALGAARFPEAARWLTRALESRPVDWRARCFLSEAYLCLRDERRAIAEMDRALEEAPEAERPQVLAWRGALDLWLGRYAEALERSERARREGASCAYCWRGAALLKLGRVKEALEALDETLERYPLDLEAWVWRAEAKRALGRHKEALADLARVPESAGLWARVNRALIKRALGDAAGCEAEAKGLPADMLESVRRRTGKSATHELLEAALDLAKGFRRSEYRQAVWLR